MYYTYIYNSDRQIYLHTQHILHAGTWNPSSRSDHSGLPRPCPASPGVLLWKNTDLPWDKRDTQFLLPARDPLSYPSGKQPSFSQQISPALWICTMEGMCIVGELVHHGVCTPQGGVHMGCVYHGVCGYMGCVCTVGCVHHGGYVP